jgi:anti-anti-sigma factor
MNNNMALQFQIETQHDIAVVHCSGRLVRGRELDEFRRGIESLDHLRMLVLDLSAIDHLDAGGLGTLLLLRRWARMNSVQMKLVNPSPFFLEVLSATGLTSVFEISSLEEVLCVLQAPGERPRYVAA